MAGPTPTNPGLIRTTWRPTATAPIQALKSYAEIMASYGVLTAVLAVILRRQRFPV